MNFKKAFKISFLLHMSPLLFFMHIPGCGGKNGKPASSKAEKVKVETKAQEPDKKEILAMTKSIDIEQVTESDLNGYKKVIKKRFKSRNCPGTSYGGIGIQFNPPFDQIGVRRKAVITLVPEGYPAAKSGIEVGDELVGDLDGLQDYRGKIGEEVTVAIKKPDGTYKDYTMLREKICLKDK